jgi:hypothetical protein
MSRTTITARIARIATKLVLDSLSADGASGEGSVAGAAVGPTVAALGVTDAAGVPALDGVGVGLTAEGVGLTLEGVGDDSALASGMADSASVVLELLADVLGRPGLVVGRGVD